MLATRLGMAALHAAIAGEWGRMVALRGTDIVTVPFEDALGKLSASKAKVIELKALLLDAEDEA